MELSLKIMGDVRLALTKHKQSNLLNHRNETINDLGNRPSHMPSIKRRGELLESGEKSGKCRIISSDGSIFVKGDAFFPPGRRQSTINYLEYEFKINGSLEPGNGESPYFQMFPWFLSIVELAKANMNDKLCKRIYHNWGLKRLVRSWTQRTDSIVSSQRPKIVLQALGL